MHNRCERKTCIKRASPKLGITELITAEKMGNLGIEASRMAAATLSIGTLA
jgi:predicted transcriptional regulator